MFETKGRFGSAKQILFKVVRSMSGFGKEDCNVSSPSVVSAVTSYRSVNSLANYSLEAELTKAQALMYWRRMDPPK